MSGLEKIIGHITKESEAVTGELLKEASKKAEAIVSESEKKTLDECDRIKKKAEAEALNIGERAEASAALKTKRILLSAKQELIEDTIAMIMKELNSLSDAEYVGYFTKLFEKHIPSQDAVMRLSKNDLSRLGDKLDGFVKMAAEKGSKLTVAKEAADIANGFVLDFGGVEENCSFAALIEQNSEEIKDIISKKLFS